MVDLIGGYFGKMTDFENLVRGIFWFKWGLGFTLEDLDLLVVA